ncbi:unnamed protein product [Nippostrongylus brasiliensis]|uniref:Large ribosomal subunit protein P1 n=1 Tax=Nippostrongylus brasiliensis TaxID=27835 RepID=A0A0N4Y9Z9_NIPBR|nr:unnamed protein product [Nippostrongylus brasiliensis]
MAHAKRKTRKLRGHVSHGHGRIGKHRKHPGGRGKAGGQHHHRINRDKYHPGLFGKVGMRVFHLNKNHYYCPTVNVDKLWSLVPETIKEQANASKAPVIDCVKAGYFKVLGKGLLPKQPLIVKAKYFSHEAEDKIKAAGGACTLQLALEMALNQEMACVYAALILQDDEVAITGDKIATLLKAANVEFEPFWPGLFAKAVEGVDVKVS